MPGRHDGALAGRELDALAGRQVDAGVALVGARGKRRLGPQPPDPELDHPCTRADEGRVGDEIAGEARTDSPVAAGRR